MGVLKDVDCKQVSNSKTVMSGNEHAVVHSGVAYSGRCANKECKAYNGTVVCNRGRGCFVVNEDIMAGLVKCPACSLPFELVHVCLYQCKARVTIVDHDEQSQDYNPSGDNVVLLGGQQQKGLIKPNALLTVQTLGPKNKCAVM
eukprot:Rhum_TRINITY_DN21268_c0_g1::Rhum_TRINITY_DN21268_c0_g1_i1::g.173581::m.173581